MLFTLQPSSQETYVALDCPQYSERPQIATVLERDESGLLTIKWMDGTRTRKIYLYYEGRKKIPWIERIDSKQVIKEGIKLTPTGYLPQSTQRELKQLLYPPIGGY